MFKALMGGGRSSSDARSSSSSKSGSSKRKSHSKSSSTVSRKSSSRGDDRDRGLGDLSAYPSSSSSGNRSSKRYAPSAAGESVASSYATAEPSFPGESDPVIVERAPKRRDTDYDERDDRYRESRDRDGKSRSGRERDDSRDRDSRRRERSRTQSGDGYAPGDPLPSSSPGGQFGPFPATSSPPSQGVYPTGSMSDPQTPTPALDPHVQQQFPGQFPSSFAEPYRPPNPAGEAADYYGDQGQSVAEQPGVRPQPPLVIPNSHAHLMPASPTANPPPEPSSLGQTGAAAAYYDDEDQAGPDTHISQQASSSPASRPPKPSKPSKPSLQTAGILGATAAATAYGVGSGSTEHHASSGSPGIFVPPAVTTTYGVEGGSPEHHASSGPPASYTPPAWSSSPPKPSNSHGVGAAVGAAAAGAAAGYMLGHNHHSSSSVDHTSQYTMQNPDDVSQIGIGYPGPALYNNGPSNAGHHGAGGVLGPLGAAGAAGAIGYAASPLHPHHAALYHGAPFPSGALAFQQRQRGPLDKFIDFWRDPEGVGMFEDYTESIGICKYCFEPGTTSRDAPRTHHYKARRRSSDRVSAGARVEKLTRYASSEDESRRRKSSSRKSWLPGLLGGYAVKSLFDNKDFDDTYSVRSGRVASASHDSESTSASGRRSQTSRGVYRSSSHRSRSPDRVGRSSYPDAKIGRYEESRRPGSHSRSRSRSPSRSHALRDAALGAAIGTAAVSVAKSHHRDRSRSRSPRKTRGRKSSSSDASFVDISGPSKRAVGGFGSFFTAGSENRKKRHPRRRKSIFSFNNSSSSSLDADLAFGSGFAKRPAGKLKKKKKQSPKRDKGDVDARLIALGATATALAASSPHRTKRTGEMFVGQGSRSGRSDYTSSVTNDDGWEDLDSEGQASSVSSALAFGGGGMFGSDDSHSSDSSSKWGWGWGGKGKKKKKRDKKKRRSSSSSDKRFSTGAALAAGAAGAAALAYHRDHKSSNQDAESSVVSLQHVAPMPTSDPSRFDTIAVSSYPPVQPPLVRPGSIPLQQPQPVAPVSQAVYTTQGAPLHSYSAPAIPPAFVSPFSAYEPQQPGPERQVWNQPGSEFYDHRDLSYRDNRPPRRRDSSPAPLTEPLETATPSTLKRRSTAKDQPSVQFELTREQADKERRADRLERLRREVERDASREAEREGRIQLIDTEREIAPQDTSHEPRQSWDRQYDNRSTERDESKKDKGSSWVPAATAVGAVSAIGAASILSEKPSSEVTSEASERSSSERREKRRAERRRATEPLPSVSSFPESEREVGAAGDLASAVEEPEHIKTTAFRGVGRKKPVYDDYAEFFYPEKLRHSPDSTARRESPSMPKIIEIEPASESSRFVEEPRLKSNNLPWPVPELRIIEPTPPHSTSGSVKDVLSPMISPIEPVEEETKIERQPTGSRVSWGEPSTHEYEVPSTSSEHDSVDLDLRNREHSFEETDRDISHGYSYVAPSADTSHGFGEDIEFAATLAAGTQAAGFDPALVTDDPTYHTRTSPPGSEIRERSISPRSQAPRSSVEDVIETPQVESGRIFSDRPIFADPETSLPGNLNEKSPEVETPPSSSQPTFSKVGERSVPVDTREKQEESESPGDDAFFMPGGFESKERPKKVKHRRSDSPVESEIISRSVTSQPLIDEPESFEKSREISGDLDLNDTAEDDGAEDKKKKKRKKRRSKRDSDNFNDTASIASSVATTSTTGEKRKSTDDKEKEKRSGGFFSSIFGSRVSEPIESSSKRSSSTENLPIREVQSEIGPRTPEESRRRRKERSSRHRSSSRGESLDNDSRPYDDGALDQEDSFTADKENINVESYKSSRQRREDKRRQRYGEMVELGKPAEYEKDRKTSQDADRDLSFLAEGPEMPSRQDYGEYDGASGRSSSTDAETRGIGLGLLGQRPRSQSITPPASERIVEPIPRSQARSVSPDRNLIQGEGDDRGLRSRHSSDNLCSTESPTAVPVHFRLPPTSPRTQRSPSASSSTAVSPSSPTQGKRRPNSTEFRNIREIRPLWLVERHGASKADAQEDESLPSLPSSASASVEDLTALPDENFWETPSYGHPIQGTRGLGDTDIPIVKYHDAGNDTLGSQQGTPTRATFSQAHMYVPHQSRKEQLGYEFHSPSELLQDPSAYGELPPSPTLDALPSVEGSAVGVKEDESLERDLESLPPLPTSRPSTPEDKTIHASEAEETTPTQAQVAPVTRDITGAFDGSGFGGFIGAAVAAAFTDNTSMPSEITHPILGMPVDLHDEAVDDDDDGAKTVVGDEFSVIPPTEPSSSAFGSTAPFDISSLLDDAAIAAQTRDRAESITTDASLHSALEDQPKSDTDTVVGESRELLHSETEFSIDEPYETPVEEIDGFVHVNVPDFDEGVSREQPSTETFMAPVAPEQAPEDLEKRVDATTAETPESTSKSIDEPTETKEEDTTVEATPSASSKKNKKKKKKKGKNVDLEDQEPAQSLEASAPTPTPASEPEPAETIPSTPKEDEMGGYATPPEQAAVEEEHVIEQSRALEQTFVPEEVHRAEREIIPEDAPITEIPPTSEKALAPEEDLASAPAPAPEQPLVSDEAPAVGEREIPQTTVVSDKEPDSETAKVEDTPEPLESGKAVESEPTQPEEAEQPAADSGLSKKAKKKKKRKSKAAAEEAAQSAADAAVEPTEKAEASTEAVCPAEPAEPAEPIESVIESTRSGEVDVPVSEGPEQTSSKLDGITPAEETSEAEKPTLQSTDQIPEPADEVPALENTAETAVSGELVEVVQEQEAAEEFMDAQEEAAPVDTEKSEALEPVPQTEAELQQQQLEKETIPFEPVAQVEDTPIPEDFSVPVPGPSAEESPEVTEPKQEADVAAPEKEVTLSRKASKKNKKKNKRKSTTDSLPEAEPGDAQQSEKPEQGVAESDTQLAPAEEETVSKEEQPGILEGTHETSTELLNETPSTEEVVETANDSQPVDLTESAEKDISEEVQEDQPKKKGKKSKKNRKSANLSDLKPEAKPDDSTPTDAEAQLPEPAGDEAPPVDEDQAPEIKETQEDPTEIAAVETVPEKIESEPSVPVGNAETNDSEPHVLEEPTMERMSEPEAGESTPTGKKSKKNKKKKKQQSLSSSPDESSTAAVEQAPMADVADVAAEAPAAPEEPTPSLDQEPAAEMSVEKEQPVEEPSLEAAEPPVEQPEPEPESAAPLTAAQKKKAKEDRKKKRQSMALDEAEASEAVAEPVTEDATAEGDERPADEPVATQDLEAEKSITTEHSEVVEPAESEKAEEPVASQEADVDKPIAIEEPEVVESTIPEQVEEPVQEDDAAAKEEESKLLEPEVQESKLDVEESNEPASVISEADQPASTDVQPAVENADVPASLETAAQVEDQSVPGPETAQTTELEKEASAEEPAADNLAPVTHPGPEDQPKDLEVEATQDKEIGQDFVQAEPKGDETPAAPESSPETPAQEEPQATTSKKDKKKKKKKRQSAALEESQATPTPTAEQEPSEQPAEVTSEPATADAAAAVEETARESVLEQQERVDEQDKGDEPVTTELTTDAPAPEDEQATLAQDQDTPVVPDEPISEQAAVPESEETLAPPADDFDQSKAAPLEEPAAESKEPVEQAPHPTEETQTPTSKKKEKKKKKKKGQSVSLDEGQPAAANEEAAPEPFTEPEVESIAAPEDAPPVATSEAEVVETSVPEDLAPESMEPEIEELQAKEPELVQPLPSESKEPEGEEPVLEPKEPEGEESKQAEEPQTATSKKKAKKDKKKRKSVSFATEEPLAQTAEPTEAESSQTPVETEQSVQDDAADAKVEPSVETQPTSDEPSEAPVTTEKTTPDEPKHEDQDRSLEITEPATEAQADVNEKGEDAIADEPPSEESDAVELTDAPAAIQDSQQEKEPGVTEPDALEPPAEPDQAATNDAEPELEAKPKSKKDKKKKKRKTLDAIEEPSVVIPEASESQIPAEPTPAEPEAPLDSTTSVEEKPEEPAQETEKQDEDTGLKSAKAKRKAKKDKKRQSKNMDLDDAESTQKLSEDQPQELSTPAETVAAEETLPETSEAQTTAEPEFPQPSVETAIPPSEDDGKENQSHDTGIHAADDKDLTWTDNNVSSQVEQEPEISSAYPTLPEHETTKPNPDLVSTEASAIADVDTDAVREAQSFPSDQSVIAGDASKVQVDTPASAEPSEEQHPSETSPVPSQDVGELGIEREVIETDTAGEKAKDTEITETDETREEKYTDMEKELPPVAGEVEEPVVEAEPVHERMPEPEENAPADQEKAESAGPSRKLSKKQKKKQRQAEKAASLQDQTAPPAVEGEDEPKVPAASDEQPSELTSSQKTQDVIAVREETTHDAEETVELSAAEAVPVTTIEHADTNVEIPDIPSEQAKDIEADVISPVVDAAHEDTVEEKPVIPESSEAEIPLTSQEEPEKPDGEAIQETIISDIVVEEPVTIPESDTLEERSPEISQAPEATPEQTTKDKELLAGDDETSREVPDVEEKVNEPPVELDEEKPLSRKESKKKKKKAKKQAKELLEETPGPSIEQEKAEEHIAEHELVDSPVAGSRVVHEEDAAESQRKLDETPEQPEQAVPLSPVAAPLPMEKEMDAPSDSAFQVEQPLVEEKQAPQVEQEQIEEPQTAATEVLESGVLDEAAEPSSQPEAEQPLSRKLSKKEKKKAKKKAAQQQEAESAPEPAKDDLVEEIDEGPKEETPKCEPVEEWLATGESVEEEPAKEETAAPQTITTEPALAVSEQPDEPEAPLSRKLSKKEKRKKRKESKVLESQEPEGEQMKEQMDIGTSEEQSQTEKDEPRSLGAGRSAQHDDGWPAIDWEKGKIDAVEQSSEASLEAYAAPFEPEIPEYHESAIPEALQHPQEEQSDNTEVERTESVLREDTGKASTLPETSVENVEPSTRSTPESADVASQNQSKVSSIFPDLERGLFRRPALSQIAQPVKDGAEEETVDQGTIRDRAIPVLEAPIVTTELRKSGPTPSSELLRDGSIFGGPLATATMRELRKEASKTEITLEDPFIDDKPYDVYEEPNEASRSIEVQQKDDTIPETTRGLASHYDTPLCMPFSEPEDTTAMVVDEQEQEPGTPCELQRTQSIHGRHSHPARPWSLEDGQRTPPGKVQESGSPQRGTLHPITEREPEGRVETGGGSGSIVRDHGTPRLEMKPEHILPRPQTPVRKFTENAMGRRGWPTSDNEQSSDQTDEDWEAAVKKQSPQTLSPKKGWPAEMLKTPEKDRPILRPSSVGSTKSSTSLRRLAHSTSGDLRAAAVAAATAATATAFATGAAAGAALGGEHQSEASSPQPPRSPTYTDLDLDVEQIASSSSYDPVTDKGKRPIRNMTDVYEGWGETPSSPRSPSRPPSVRHRRSMQHLQELEFRLDQLISENRELAAARDAAENKLRNASVARRKSDQALNTRDAHLRDREAELEQLKSSVEWFQKEVTRLNDENSGLTTSNSALIAAHAHELLTTRETSTREIDTLRSQNEKLSGNLQDKIREEIEAALMQKNAELRRLREELENARDKVKELQQQIAASMNDNVIAFRDEDYFEAACQKLCGHVQQWVLRFSKHSDHRRCRKLIEVQDEKVADRFDNAILDGSDTDAYLADRVRRRDVFMSVVMTMVWEFIFTRYLFGMDREQRQKLKSLEKQLVEVGPRGSIHRWRATTLSLLAKRAAFAKQRENDTEAVALEIFETLSRLLPPPTQVESQLLESLRKVLRVAVSLSIEMRTQLAEYIMLPPLQPEYDTNGDLARQVFFNASLMNERSGETTSNEDLESQQAVVRVVLFPLVVKKGNDTGGGDDEVVVCPAQVLIARPGKDKRLSRMASGDRMSIDAARSVHSIAPSSTMDMSNVI